jgi:hypothetical protein
MGRIMSYAANNETLDLPSDKALAADYLVIGSGAMGMAFTDVIVTESQDTVIMVDRHDQPGGHWNDAYPFVRLHGPSASYGVNSRPLGDESIEQTGLNRGFYEAASAAEICSYFDRVMRKQFLPSGRVQYFSMCDYKGEGKFVSLTSGVEHRVEVRKKIVDATFTDTNVPSRRPPKYAVAPGMQSIPPNALPSIGAHAERYVVIGAGKTGIDVCLWLLEHDVPADRITWIMPRDSWLVDRAHVQPRAQFFADRMGALALQTELIQKAESFHDLFRLLKQHGQLLRIDERVAPRRFRCATVSQAELKELRRIANVVRLGHVQRIEAARIVLDGGSIATNGGVIHVDCTSSGIGSREPVPVFNDGTITLQAVRTCQQSFSSALIAHIELNYADEVEKNRLCKPIPLPIRDVDWLKMFLANLGNQLLWSRTPELRNWIAKSRLDPNYGRTQALTDVESALVQRFKDGAAPATKKLIELLGA